MKGEGMKRIVLLAVVLLFTADFGFGQDKGFGVGFIAGNPTGISLKGWAGKTTAYDAALAWHLGDNSALEIHADFLWHNYGLFKVSKGKLPLYYGLGLSGVLVSDFVLGVRGVAGLDYMFKGVPLDLFFEVAPTLNLIPGTDFDVGFGLGMRYFF
jgi:hypothetical protein